jgi:acyl-CoA dehydrogenase
MHQIQVACLIRHGKTPYLQDYLREVAEQQLLLASATSETGVGGNVRNSLCFIEPTVSGYRLEKRASVLSYGDQADGVLATARRSADAAPTDQLLVAIPRRDFSLEKTTEWNALGFRGTCSNGYVLRAEGDNGQIMADPYGDIAGQTMTPISHILWSFAWLGIATEAVHKARQYTRAESRKKPGETLPSALRAAELYGELQEMESLVRNTARDYAEVMDDYDALASLKFAIRVNNLKISASRMVVELVNKALSVVGLSGYREDTPYSMGRLLRDSLAAPIQVNNDRLFGSNAQWLRIYKED